MDHASLTFEITLESSFAHPIQERAPSPGRGYIIGTEVQPLTDVSPSHIDIRNDGIDRKGW